MNKLKINLTNCYGIQSLTHEFDFTPNAANSNAKAYAIYAPNGLMKTSFSRTFEDIGKGESPKEERYNRQSAYLVESDLQTISPSAIYVLKSEIDIREDSPAITNILVDPENKARYDQLLVELDKLKNKLLGALQKSSKVKKLEIEQTILKDWAETDFSSLIQKIIDCPISDDLSSYEYNTIFDPKAIEVLKSSEFISKANEFNERYQELFNQTGTIYTKGIFNPARADLAFTSLDKQGFFSGGHRVQLRGEQSPLDRAELEQKLKQLHSRIDEDETLRKLRTSLAKNAQTQALMDLFEKLSVGQVEFLLDKLAPANQAQFRKDLWAYSVQSSGEGTAYCQAYGSNKNEIDSIEAKAALAAPKWTQAVELFNDRFVDMPFTLSVANQTQAALGKENARLKFTFKDGIDTVEWSRQEIKTLSQGEKRALYLLNFIFEVEARKLANQETLFIIDDIADSFDYKNKHAIVQYLEDLSLAPYFHQLVLTHNFDFFRTLAINFVPRDRCLMANRSGSTISLAKADGIRNYFIGMWKDNVAKSDFILCASIPFTRNLIEYTKNKKDKNYLTLTSLLHWKKGTDQITVGQYLGIYNGLFGTTHNVNRDQPVIDLIFAKASETCLRTQHDGLNLEDKVLLSIAIRLRAEVFLISQLRILLNDPQYWCDADSQFGNLMKLYSASVPSALPLRTLEKVSITVSSNIHLNSFMYEPILDLTIEHLIKLYNEVCEL